MGAPTEGEARGATLLKAGGQDARLKTSDARRPVGRTLAGVPFAPAARSRLESNMAAGPAHPAFLTALRSGKPAVVFQAGHHSPSTQTGEGRCGVAEASPAHSPPAHP